MDKLKQYGVIGLVAIIAIVALVLSINSLSINTKGNEGGQSLGAVATSTVALSRVPNIVLDGYAGKGFVRTAYDMGHTGLNGLYVGYQAGNCTTGTTTQIALQNTTGKTLYISDAFLTINGMANSAVKFAIGTSSVAFVPRDGAFPTDAIASQGNQSIEWVSIAQSTATSTTYWLADNRGLDTRDGAGSWYNVRVLPGEYIVGYATSTATSESGVTSTSSLWNCQYGITAKEADNANL